MLYTVEILYVLDKVNMAEGVYTAGKVYMVSKNLCGNTKK